MVVYLMSTNYYFRFQSELNKNSWFETEIVGLVSKHKVMKYKQKRHPEYALLQYKLIKFSLSVRVCGC